MEPRWAKGLWLGKRFSTEEHVVSTADGVVIRSSAVRPHPDVEYDSQLFDGLVGLPWDPMGKGTELSPDDAPELPRVQVPRAEADLHPRVRRVMISKAYVERFGPTPGCNKCRKIVAGDNSNPSLSHDPACRNRMEDLLAQDPDLAKVLDRARLREDAFLARQVEAGAELGTRPVPGGAASSSAPAPDADLDGDPARSRGESTVTYKSDHPADEPGPEDDDGMELPIPTADTAVAPGPHVPETSASGAKRSRDGADGDEDRGDAQDPDDPIDVEVGSCELKSVLMLGEKKKRNVKLGEDCHEGKYEVCELFSPPRVSAAATARGLRGGWAPRSLSC